jgi:lipid-A-disaccharide synthase
LDRDQLLLQTIQKLNSKKIYIISGERSGDLHASNLVLALGELDSSLSFRGMGGSFSSQAGVELTVDYDEVALMGFLEVVLGFRKVLKYLKLIKQDILSFKPQAIILVDYGGFNMRIAAFAKVNRIPVHYYIPPKIWAWNQKRAIKLKAITDHIYSILPFEPIFFKKFGLDVTYVGNPLRDEIKKFTPHKFFLQKNELSYKPIIALLPGSRAQELKAMLEPMLELVKEYSQFQFVIAGVENLDSKLYLAAKTAGIRVIFNQTYDLLTHALAAVVTSGTATLETALFRVPQVVVYRTSPISYIIAKNLIRVPFISLVNLIADKEVVKELIQNDFSMENLRIELTRILSNQVVKVSIYQSYDLIQERLGNESASKNTAKLILNTFQK